jgi:hypothetical protein
MESLPNSLIKLTQGRAPPQRSDDVVYVFRKSFRLRRARIACIGGSLHFLGAFASLNVPSISCGDANMRQRYMARIPGDVKFERC